MGEFKVIQVRRRVNLTSTLLTTNFTAILIICIPITSLKRWNTAVIWTSPLSQMPLFRQHIESGKLGLPPLTWTQLPKHNKFEPCLCLKSKIGPLWRRSDNQRQRVSILVSELFSHRIKNLQGKLRRTTAPHASNPNRCSRPRSPCFIPCIQVRRTWWRTAYHCFDAPYSLGNLVVDHHNSGKANSLLRI